MKLTALVLTAILTTCTASAPAFAQMFCAPYEQVLAAASERFGEVPVSRGISQRGHVLEILQNAETLTFTVIGVSTDGNACVLDGGEGWDNVEAKPVVPGQDG